MARRAGRREGGPAPRETRSGRGLLRALGLTLASALVWGVAHLRAGHRLAGSLLLGVFALLAVVAGVAAVGFRSDLLRIAVQPDWLSAIAIGALVLGLLWVLVVIRSYQVVRPYGMTTRARTLGATTVMVLCVLVSAPLVWAAHNTYIYRDALTSIFQAGGSGKPVDADDPWDGRRRVNVLLLGGDAAANREGVRTDSMTLASIDTKTGDTVLISLPRNLESFPMPPGPARDRFPYGFTGDGAQTPGLLNEVYQFAEDHPDLVPGVPKDRRGPTLISGTISTILNQPVDYYVLVDMFGFADIVDAIGGVKVKITEPISYGQQGAVLQPGERTLSGKEALWYGRSRNNSDDYTRMSRQKCMLRAIAKQADARRVLTKFEKLAGATKRAISTDVPQELLPALMGLSNKVKDGAKINSLQFVPPLIQTGNPDLNLIHRLTAKAITSSETRADARMDPKPTPQPGRTDASGQDGRPGQGGQADKDQAKPVSLDASCPF